MKCIPIVIISWFIMFISLPIEVFACAELERLRNEARDARDEAQRKYSELIGRNNLSTVQSLLGARPSSINDDDDDDDDDKAVHGDMIGQAEEDTQTIAKNFAIVNEAERKRDEAQVALEIAQSKLDLCELKSEVILGCGHPISSGHMRYQYGCGHFDYNCQESKHQLRNCPTNRYGQSCQYDSYRMCSGHVHAY